MSHQNRKQQDYKIVQFRGMTLVEMLVAISVLALLLALVNGLYAWHLDSAKYKQALHLVDALNQAVSDYHEKFDVWPVGSPKGRLQPVLNTIGTEHQTRESFSKISPNLIFTVDGQFRCRDPWGTEPRYLFSTIDDAELRRQVELNAGIPIIECAGPDRSFGDHISARQADNIRSDEPLGFE